MGLDIYIEKRHYVEMEDSEENETNSELAYYRKINFVVNFFENYFKVDNCIEHKIDVEMVKELKRRCEKVLEVKTDECSKELLPTISGFFFGSTEYSEYYYKNVQEVLDSLDSIIEEFDELEEKEYIYFYIWY